MDDGGWTSSFQRGNEKTQRERIRTGDDFFNGVLQTENFQIPPGSGRENGAKHHLFARKAKIAMDYFI